MSELPITSARPKKPHILHLIDSLDVGGAETVAVTIANQLCNWGYRVTLGTTRREGPLSERISSRVERLSLDRRHRFDLGALKRLRDFIESESVDLIHAHSTTVFLASRVAGSRTQTALLWHDHYGRLDSQARSPLLYKLIRSRIAGILAVNRSLAAWSRTRLKMNPECVWYRPNFVEEPEHPTDPPSLPGSSGFRIVCLANLRPQKNHFTLLKALGQVSSDLDDWSLLLVGYPSDQEYAQEVERLITSAGLAGRTHFLGGRTDAQAVLAGCDIGVLTSDSEGLPLSLLEYGFAGLAVLATDVGQNAEVLENGECGVLVPAGDPQAIATGLARLIADADLRKTLASRLGKRVRDRYSASAAMPEICAVYSSLIRDAAS